MRYLKYIILFLLFAFFAFPVHAATYSVCAGACDYNTITEVNAVDFANGDIIEFEKGESFDDANLTLAGIVTDPDLKTITIQATGAGANPDICETHLVDIDNVGLSIILKDLQINSQEYTPAYPKVRLESLADITIDGVDMDGSINWVDDEMDAIRITSSTGAVEVKNCEIKYWGLSTFWDSPATPSGELDCVGIVVDKKTAGTLSIHDNTIFGIESDGIMLQDVRVTHSIYDNEIYNCGENSVDFKGCRYGSLYGNNLYREATFTGISGSSYSDAYTGIVNLINFRPAYGGVNQDIDIYGNVIGPTDERNITIHTSSAGGAIQADGNDNINIYYNYFKEAKNHISVFEYTYSARIKYNVFDGLKNGGQFIYGSNSQGGVVYFNNNVWYSPTNITDPSIEGYVRFYAGSFDLTNNAFFVDETSEVILYVRTAATLTGNNNVWFNENGAPGEIWFLDDTYYDSTELAGWKIASGFDEDQYVNPDFNNAASDEFWPDAGTSPLVDTGATLNQLHDDALNLATTWSPISISTSDQDDFGTDATPWEIGAFVYSGAEDPPQPTMTKTTTTPLVCPNGQDPLDVTFSFTTDVNAHGRISTTEQTWDVMTSAKAMDTGAGTKTHSHVVSLACGQTISYWCSASTEAGDNGAEATTVEHEVVIGAEQDPAESYPVVLYNDSSGGATTTLYNDSSGGATVTLY